MTKNDFFLKLKKQNIFWSYDLSAILSDEVIIEKTLIYADVDDIQNLFLFFKFTQIKKIWEQNIVTDLRHYKLNYYLGKMFFNIRNITLFLNKKSVANSRYEKIRKLTT